MVELKNTKDSIDITSIINVTGREPEGSIKPLLSPLDCYTRIKRVKQEDGEDVVYSEVTVSLKGTTHDPHLVIQVSEVLALIHDKALRFKNIIEFTAKCINSINHDQTESNPADGRK